MLEIDGSLHSGSGTIVRQAIAFSALTGRPVHVVNARVRRPQPGLRHRHIRVVEAIRDLVDGTAEGLSPGSRELWFKPGAMKTGRRYVWDIGTAGSTTMLGVALLPLLAFASAPIHIELHGGLFQDFAPSFFHVESVLVPLLRRMGLKVGRSVDESPRLCAERRRIVFSLGSTRARTIARPATRSVERITAYLGRGTLFSSRTASGQRTNAGGGAGSSHETRLPGRDRGSP